MNAFFETALKTFISSNQKIFGESSIFLRFEKELDNKGNEQPEDGFNSEILFGHIVYRTQTNEERISPSLMLKKMPINPIIKDYVHVQFFNEVAFYANAMPVLQKLVPLQPLLAKFFDSYVHCNERTTDFLLIYENLRPQGFCTAERYSFLDVDHLTLMVRRLGQFHSYSYHAKRTIPKEFNALGKWFYDSHNELVQQMPWFFHIFCHRGLNHLRPDKRYSSRLAKVEEMVENAESFMLHLNTMERTTPMAVLCHGDYLRGNVMFRYENGRPVDMKMIDVASCRVASPVVDLSSVLYLNADQETRNQHWNHLIDSYYEGLCEVFGGEAVPTKDCIVNEFRNRAFYAYIVASYFLPRMIGKDHGMPDIYHYLSQQYSYSPLEEISKSVYQDIAQRMGGEKGTVALADVLRDMIDRDFI